MPFSHIMIIIRRVAAWNSRRSDWRRTTRPKAVRVGDHRRDRDAFRRQVAEVRRVGLLAVVAMVMVLSYFHIQLDQLTTGVVALGTLLLLVDPCMLVEVAAGLAHAFLHLAGLDQGAMARPRRSTCAPARALAATAVRAKALVRQARLAAHRLAARNRAALGAVVITSHPRIATSLAAGSLRVSAA